MREVADAGWSADEVIAWLDNGDAPQAVRRPSGFLARRLEHATTLWPDAAGRARAVEAARDSQRAEHARHVEWEGDWQMPRSAAVLAEVRASFSRSVPAQQEEPGMGDVVRTDDGLPVLEEFTREQIIDLRRDAEKDPSVIEFTINTAGEVYARRLYSNRLVDQAVNRPVRSGLMVMDRRWGSA
ncbi:hypothetical protein [Actinacidiphila oryziradicis]|uniref:Uncharacterized protein n=1 Tax=Actinacidiphila oryziradicis TaxID=2571141 RepID=A0A4U0RNI6_9ACTN|nr:hypothetical protein [Actinacidiphila oryziradicis]TJZ97443.1 hypothetical protein FCI23_49640 [Actinacidiphila oryziradicis]